MFFIPGCVISLFTFPGVIVHEFAHRFFADLGGVEVYEACYYRIGNPAGYVIHGPTPNLRSAVLVSVGPLIVNTVLCSLLTFVASLPCFILGDAAASWVNYLLLWAGFSIGMHAFPSNQDMQSLTAEVSAVHGGGPVVVVARIFAGFFAVANALRFFWFDAIYAFGISMFLPWALGLV